MENNASYYDERFLIENLADMSDKCFDVKYLRITPTSQVFSKCRDSLKMLKIKLSKEINACKNLYDDPSIDYATSFQMRLVSYMRQSCWETLNVVDGILRNINNNHFGRIYTDALINQSGYVLGLGVATLTKHDLLIDLFDHAYDDEDAQKQYPQLVKCAEEESDNRRLAGFDEDDKFLNRHKKMICDLFASERESVSPFVVIKNKPDNDASL